jgi:hypothetical protein
MADAAEVGPTCDGEDEDEVAAPWNGGVPDGTRSWVKALHRLISSVYGDGRETGEEPEWDEENDGYFVDSEEDRRELPHGALEPFLRQPYHMVH